MKALVIGGAGFVGGYLLEQLRAQDWQCFATKLPHERIEADGVQALDLDIRDAEATKSLLQEVRSDVVFHLAAQSSVGLSWKSPELTVQINILGALHVLEAVRALSPAPRLLLIGSGEEYGAARPGELPIGEDNPLRPGNIYAVTKVTQSMLGVLYAKAYQLPVICVRAFNHIGPEQSEGFVVADFCRQVARIEQGLADPVLFVGNLASRRDFTDVRDVVRAYALLAEKGRVGEIYNVGSGQSVSIQSILDTLLGLADLPIEGRVDPEKFRPIDVPDITADIAKLTADTGWQRQYALEDTLRDTLSYWRKKAGEEKHGVS